MCSHCHCSAHLVLVDILLEGLPESLPTVLCFADTALSASLEECKGVESDVGVGGALSMFSLSLSSCSLTVAGSMKGTTSKTLNDF